MKKLVSYFVERHLVTNVLFFGLILLGILTWFKIGKEELPEFASNWVRVSTVYPGAPAEDVELFVTKPMEDELKGVLGIEEIITTSSVGSSSIRITIDDDYPDKDEVLQEIKDAIYRTQLPSEVRDLPRIRQFKSAEKAILDIGIYHKDYAFLDTKGRAEVQKYILSFENQLLTMPEVASIEKSHYRKPELQIKVDPKKILKKEIGLAAIREQIQTNNVRAPIGSLKDKGESKVTAVNELEDVPSLKSLILRGNYSGAQINLDEVGTIEDGHEDVNSIFKINGHEGVFINVKKNVATDILTAQKAVMRFIENFKKSNKNAPIGIVLMDDESYAVTNRLDIVSTNGLLGFVLIIVVLLVFLNLKTGFWVAMGIPFSIAFTLVIASIVGYTVNNMTLAGIIIVLGIVVDDAIIIAENISRKKEEGLPLKEAAIEGTLEVIKPITASILTTCVAFIPLIFFEGFFGKLVSYIPLIVILMLLGSLVESIFILPGHLSSPTPLLDRYSKEENADSWYHRYERMYAKFLVKVFQHRVIVFSIFSVLLGGAFYLYNTKMKFVMFPREESQEIFLKVKAKKEFTRFETAKAIQPLEEMFVNETENVVAVRSSIGLSRRGGEVRENEASILVELFPADDRKQSLNDLLNRWEKESKNIQGLEDVRFLRGRWGNDSGSALELRILENDDKKRADIAKKLEDILKGYEDVTDVEVEVPLLKNEYVFQIRQDRLVKYDVAPSQLTATLRSFVEGSILYSINKGDEEVDVRLTVRDDVKDNLEALLDLRVPNRQGSLTFLRNMVEIVEVQKPVNITRANYKRVTTLFANPKAGSKVTPLQVARRLEENVFPKIYNEFPTAALSWAGEVKDSRESQGEFRDSVIIVVLLIYLILVIMFDSLTKPLIVLSVVPFGVAGIIFILVAHGMSVYGFFAAIGALGMIGVVINDAIVMIDKIENVLASEGERSHDLIARVAATRLRPVVVTTVTTVVGVLPTAYGIGGYDSLLAEMMLTMGWGLLLGTVITLVLIPTIYSFTVKTIRFEFRDASN
jgi:multidrug efflux pump subunit AcrB